MGRKEPTLKAKLAAALRELFKIPHEHAVLMSADQLIGLADFHHIVYHAHGGSDEHHNLEPMLRADHKDRTAKVDIPQIAKTRRLARTTAEFHRLMAIPRDERPPKKSRWGSRPFPKRRKQR